MTRTETPARTTFHVTVVQSATTASQATFSVPGMVLSRTELRAVLDDRLVRHVWCYTCGESAVDCPDMRGLVRSVPGWWPTVAGRDVGWSRGA